MNAFQNAQRFVLILCVAGPACWARQPNVVLVMTDDQGWYDVGVHGNEAIETPAMDRLCGQGVEFTRFYASPVCTPTRASLLTGRHYHRTGAIDTYRGLDVMDTREVTLGQVFQKAGYRTGLYGKWHLGRYMKYHPIHRGIDDFFGFINRYFDSPELWHDDKRVKTTGYVTDVLTDAAIDFIATNKERPFFCYVPYNAPHSPYLAPDPLVQKYISKGLPLYDAQIYAMITSIDQNVGRLMKTIHDLGLTKDTIFIFMTDNGGVSRHYKAGLRGGKGSVYEGGVRVPLFVRWPGQFPAGAKVDAMAQHVDLFPTLCELLDVPLPDDRIIDGKSLLTLLKEGKGDSPHEYLFHQWNRTAPSPDKSWAARDTRYKLANGELFDLQEDPGEETDIAAQHPEIVKRLRGKFMDWFADVTAGRKYEHVPIEVGRGDENPVENDIEWAAPTGKKHRIRYVHYNRSRIENWTAP